MTLSHVTSRLGLFAGAIAFTSILGTSILGFAAAQAQAAKAPYYQVELNQALSAPKNKMVKGSFFRCAGNTCASNSDSASAKNMCVWVAREFGEVKSFQAGKRILTADELAKCNKK